MRLQRQLSATAVAIAVASVHELGQQGVVVHSSQCLLLPCGLCIVSRKAGLLAYFSLCAELACPFTVLRLVALQDEVLDMAKKVMANGIQLLVIGACAAPVWHRNAESPF